MIAAMSVVVVVGPVSVCYSYVYFYFKHWIGWSVGYRIFFVLFF